jgi:uncharacterized protein with HEPN domain
MPPDQAPQGDDARASETMLDQKRIEHILLCARDACTIVGSLDADQLAKDMVRVRALVNCFTEIGEAASRLTPATRQLLGDVPWRAIIGMRNIIVHIYWGIDVHELVKTTKDDLPSLIAAIERSRWS